MSGDGFNKLFFKVTIAFNLGTSNTYILIKNASEGHSERKSKLALDRESVSVLIRKCKFFDTQVWLNALIE